MSVARGERIKFEALYLLADYYDPILLVLNL